MKEYSFLVRSPKNRSESASVRKTYFEDLRESHFQNFRKDSPETFDIIRSRFFFWIKTAPFYYSVQKLLFMRSSVILLENGRTYKFSFSIWIYRRWNLPFDAILYFLEERTFFFLWDSQIFIIFNKRTALIKMHNISRSSAFGLLLARLIYVHPDWITT